MSTFNSVLFTPFSPTQAWWLDGPLKQTVSCCMWTPRIMTHGPPFSPSSPESLYPTFVHPSTSKVFSTTTQLQALILRVMFASYLAEITQSLHLSPPHGKKSYGSRRPSGDYRLLNTSAPSDCYPVPHIKDFNISLDGCTVFSNINL